MDYIHHALEIKGNQLQVFYMVYIFHPAVNGILRIFIDATEHSVIEGSAYDQFGWTDFVPPPPFDKTVIRYFYGTYNNGTEVTSSEEYCADCRIRGTGEKPDFWH